MGQNREQWPSGSKNVSCKEGISPLNSRNVNFMQRLSNLTGIAGADNGQEKWLHLPETIRQLRRQHLIIVKEPPITFLPRIRLLTSKLSAKVFTNQRMGI